MNAPEQTQTSTPAKKPYVKPEIVYHEVLEAMAVACTGGGSKASGPCTALFS